MSPPTRLISHVIISKPRINILDLSIPSILFMNKTVYIIEDDQLTYKMIKVVISKYFDDLDIVGGNGNGQLALKECIKLKPDLAIVDIRLPDVNGLEILNILKRRTPHIKVLIYSGILRTSTIKHALQGRADGILEKSGSIEN